MKNKIKATTGQIPNSGSTTGNNNGDEGAQFGPTQFIGNFHKTLPHNEYGEVVASDYQKFETICANPALDFENTPPTNPAVAKLISPQSGRSTENLGPNPTDLDMIPAPKVLSHSVAAEMTELYWMALLRDVPFDQLSNPQNVNSAIDDISAAFQKALQSDTDAGKLALGQDLPQTANGKLRVDTKTLFRAGLLEEDFGPFVSQFFLHDINYGAQLIKQNLVPYRRNLNYLTDVPSWLAAQNTGFDKDGDAYSQDNDYAKDMQHFESPLVPGGPLPRYRIRNMRDLARFVNRDALHQAYFNAALLLLNWNAPLNKGNPYNGYKRQTAFATLGGPNLLTLVSEVAARALKVVWRQKWLVHRRLRPEAYGGLMQMQELGPANNGQNLRAYGLPHWVFDTEAAKSVKGIYGTYLLPLAFSAGSPAHPAYGAGHASVAGACVTILKAWFDETASIKAIMDKAPLIDPPQNFGILQPTDHAPDQELPFYAGSDIGNMTVRGELNKLAANVALGRSMGGVHWRSDNTRSLRLGEQVATIILKRENKLYAEQPLSLSYTNFDGQLVTIANGAVTVANNPALEAFYNQAKF